MDANETVNQSELEANTCNGCQARENRMNKVQLVSVLLLILINGESGGIFFKPVAARSKAKPKHINLDLSIELMRLIGHRKEIKKLPFRALALR